MVCVGWVAEGADAGAERGSGGVVGEGVLWMDVETTGEGALSDEDLGGVKEAQGEHGGAAGSAEMVTSANEVASVTTFPCGAGADSSTHRDHMRAFEVSILTPRMREPWSVLSEEDEEGISFAEDVRVDADADNADRLDGHRDYSPPVSQVSQDESCDGWI